MTPHQARALVEAYGSVDRAATESGMPVAKFRAFCKEHDISARVSGQATTPALVYFVRAASGEIKVGIAVSPGERVAQLQTGSPVPLYLLGVIPGGEAKERELHTRFAEHRLHLEWFDAVIFDEVAALLAEHVASSTSRRKRRSQRGGS